MTGAFSKAVRLGTLEAGGREAEGRDLAGANSAANDTVQSVWGRRGRRESAVGGGSF